MTDPYESATREGVTPTAVDLDGDLEADVSVADLDGDGTSDMVIQEDGQGGLVAYLETNGHPGWDALLRDFDADGVVDATMEDRDGDGYFELVSLADGTVATLDPATNEISEIVYPDGTVAGPGTDPTTQVDRGAPSNQNPFPAQPGLPSSPSTPQDPAQSPMQVPIDSPQSNAPGPEAPATTEPTASPESPAPGVFGSPEDDRWSSQYQTENGFCAPVSVGMIVSEFLGRLVGENETVALAQQLGFLTYSEGGRFDGWSGLNVTEIEQLVEYYGVPAHIEPDSGDPNSPGDALARIEGYLAADHGVILMVDGDEIWHPGIRDDSTSGDGPNHALVIRQVDEVNGTVTLNDPGNPNGGKEWVMTIADFMAAWDDTDPPYVAVVTDVSASGALASAPQAEAAPVAEPATAPSEATTVDLAGPASQPSPIQSQQAISGPSAVGRVGWTGIALLPVLLVAKRLSDGVTVRART